jgi:hypothetical protein
MKSIALKSLKKNEGMAEGGGGLLGGLTCAKVLPLVRAAKRTSVARQSVIPPVSLLD